MIADSSPGDSVAFDRIDGIPAIADFLRVTERQARYAREKRSLPIRYKQALGIYAFKSELVAALKADDTLPPAGR